MPGRILALDYGSKRIGVALSDELKWTAQPLETFERRTLDQDIARVEALVAANGVECVVLGLPLRLDGQEGPAVRALREFALKLKAGLSVPLVLWDERLTTKAAEDVLIAADVSRKKRKDAVNRVAAAVLLQSYLAATESSRSRMFAPETEGTFEDRSQPLKDPSYDMACHTDDGSRYRRARRARRP